MNQLQRWDHLPHTIFPLSEMALFRCMFGKYMLCQIDTSFEDNHILRQVVEQPRLYRAALCASARRD
jgi:hypothetical protein